MQLLPKRNIAIDAANTFYVILCPSGSCSIELQSWGFRDTDRSGFIRVNGEQRFNLNYGSVNGFNTAVLNPKKCLISDRRNFDTQLNTNMSNSLANYLRNYLPNGTTLLGVTCGEAWEAMNGNAERALNSVGVKLPVKYRGKLAFVAYVGNKQKTQIETLQSGGDNLVMKTNVSSECSLHSNKQFFVKS